eukprot:2899524-Ditylum_brightwellii.AAC.1
MGGDAKNNVMKNCVAKFKLGNPEELINWRIQLNHAICNKPCKLSESQFYMVEMLLGGKALQHWCQFKSQVTEESSGKDEDDKEKGGKDEGQSSASAVTPVGITKDTDIKHI